MQRRKYALLKQPFELDALGDVSLSNPVLGDVVYYDGSFWINTPYAELVDDRVASLLVAGNNIDLTYNDTLGTITIDVETLTSADISDFNEAVDDRVNSLIVAGNNIDVTYNDGANTFTIDVEGLTSADISDFSEAVDDRVGTLLVAGNNIDLTYNDGAGTLTIDVESLTSLDITDFNEAVDDRVNALLVAGSNITLTYNDGSNTLTIASSGGSSSPTTTEGDLIVRGASADIRVPIGANTHVLTVDTSLSGKVKWAEQASSTPNPATRYEFMDDFEVCPTKSYSQWQRYEPTGTVSKGTGDADRIGVVTLSTGGTSTGACYIALGADPNSTTEADKFYLEGTDALTVEFKVRFPTMTNGTETHNSRVGLADSASYANRIIAFPFWNGSAVKWRLVTTAASTSTTVDSTGTSPSGATDYLVRFVCLTGSVNMYVDGVLHCTSTTNIPTAGMTLHAGAVKSAGTTARTMEIDFARVYKTFSTVRYTA